jgi:transketolase
MIIKEFRNKVLESRRRLLIKKAHDLGGTDLVSKWVDLHVIGEKKDSLVQISKEFGFA